MLIFSKAGFYGYIRSASLSCVRLPRFSFSPHYRQDIFYLIHKALLAIQKTPPLPLL